MKQLTNKDYKKILKFYKKKIPKTRKKIKKAARKILAKKFCSCIQKVQKKTKSKKYSPIGICTKSVIQGKGFKRGKFKCKKKISIKLHKGGKRRKRTRKKKGKGFFSGWLFSNNNNKKYQKLPDDNKERSEKTLFEQYKKQLIETAKKLEFPTEEFEKWNIQESPYTKNGKVNLKLMEKHVIEAEEAFECMSKTKKGGKRRTRKKRGKGKKRKSDDEDDKKFPGKGYTLGSSSSKKKTKKQKKITDYKRKHEHGDECGICMENLVGNLKFYCDRHQFHEDCYRKMMDRNIRYCPMCRGEPNQATKDLLREKHGDQQFNDTLVSSDSDIDLLQEIR